MPQFLFHQYFQGFSFYSAFYIAPVVLGLEQQVSDKQARSEGKRPGRTAKAYQRGLEGLQAIMDYNDAQESDSFRWEITMRVVQGTGVSQKIAQQVMKDQAQSIKEHNDKFGFTFQESRKNNLNIFCSEALTCEYFAGNEFSLFIRKSSAQQPLSLWSENWRFRLE